MRALVARLLLAAALIAAQPGWIRAQTAGSPQLNQVPPPPATPPQTPDPLGRDSPRGTIERFTEAVHHDEVDLAAQYLQLTSAQRPRSEALARALNDLLDRNFTEPISALSNLPGGVPDDGLPLDRERITFGIRDKRVDAVLVRVADGRGGQIWLISSETLGQVTSWHKLTETSWIERSMPESLLRHSFLGVAWARWLVSALWIAVPVLLFWIISVLVHVALRLSVRDPARRLTIERWSRQLRWPIVLVLAVVTQFVCLPFLGFSLQFRMIWTRYAGVLLVILTAWFVWRFMQLVFDHALVVAQRHRRSGAHSLLLLGERALKVVLCLAVLLAVLKIAGVNTAAALAGVGLGGIAIALGARKSVENLLGAVFLLTDKALAIGDQCVIDNRVGWVEDITLRSIRLRTLEQTLLSVPAGILAQSSIENFTTRGKILIQTTLRLRYETSTGQLRAVLDATGQLLRTHPQLEAATSRIRLVDFSAQAIEIELFAYALTADYLTFLRVREDVLLRVAEIVESTGSTFARPTEFVYMRDAPRPDVSVPADQQPPTRH